MTAVRGSIATLLSLRSRHATWRANLAVASRMMAQPDDPSSPCGRGRARFWFNLFRTATRRSIPSVSASCDRYMKTSASSFASSSWTASGGVASSSSHRKCRVNSPTSPLRARIRFLGVCSRRSRGRRRTPTLRRGTIQTHRRLGSSSATSINEFLNAAERSPEPFESRPAPWRLPGETDKFPCTEND
jgi:hypothetical protein